ncbi:12216_t:CDS:2, partial [Entrophospora sp. SA101]
VRNNKTPDENDKEPARNPFELVMRKSFRNGIKGKTKSRNGIIDPRADESAAITVNPNPSPTLPLAIDAHFSLVNPPPRGINENSATVAPCGGFDTVNAAKATDFPLKGLATALFEDGLGTLSFNYNNISVAEVQDVNVETTPKNITSTVDLAKANAAIGTQGVLQAVYKSTDGLITWYSCADINVVDSKKS